MRKMTVNWVVSRWTRCICKGIIVCMEQAFGDKRREIKRRGIRGLFCWSTAIIYRISWHPSDRKKINKKNPQITLLLCFILKLLHSLSFPRSTTCRSIKVTHWMTTVMPNMLSLKCQNSPLLLGCPDSGIRFPWFPVTHLYQEKLGRYKSSLLQPEQHPQV